MSKSTGNFLTLRQAVDKFSADGKFYPPLPCHCFALLALLLNKIWCPEAKCRRTQHCRFNLEQADQSCYDFLAIHTVYSSLNRPFSSSRYYWLTLVNGLSRILLSTLLSSPFYPSHSGWLTLVDVLFRYALVLSWCWRHNGRCKLCGKDGWCRNFASFYISRMD